MNQTDFFAVLKQLTGSANVVSMPKAFVQITKDLPQRKQEAFTSAVKMDNVLGKR